MRRFGPLLPLAILLAAAGPAAARAPARAGEPELVGAPADLGAQEERLAVPEGTPLRASPDARAAALATVDAAIELPVLETRGEWTRVRYAGLVGWVRPGRPGPGALPDEAPEPPPAPPAGDAGSREAPRPEVLAALEARLGPPAAALPRLGPWTLYTDLDDDGLLGFLDRLAADLPNLYRERYGLDPGPAGGEAVVLFAREADYRAFAEEAGGLVGIGEGGHTAPGLAALYAGGRDRSELASLLVHELTHLLNARALGPRTPPWLEEGLANDLAYSEIGRTGRLEPGTVGGREQRQLRTETGRGTSFRTSWDGGKGAVVSLSRSLRRGELPPVEVLVHMSWRELVDPAHRSLRYAQSTFWARYLLDREPDPFRRYLWHFAAGGSDDPRLLIDALGGEWAAVDDGFRRWFLARAGELGLDEARAPN